MEILENARASLNKKLPHGSKVSIGSKNIKYERATNPLKSENTQNWKASLPPEARTVRKSELK
jgi:hypothetical protein